MIAADARCAERAADDCVITVLGPRNAAVGGARRRRVNAAKEEVKALGV